MDEKQTVGDAGRPSWDPAAAGRVLEQEIAWFEGVLGRRLEEHASQGDGGDSDLLAAHPPPELPEAGSPYAAFIRSLGLGASARLVLLLAYLPHVRPQTLDAFFLRNRPIDRRFTEFGGRNGRYHGGFLPTGETAMFLLAGSSAEARLRHHGLFASRHPLFARGVLRLDAQDPDEPRLAAPLVLMPEVRERLTTGESYEPPFSEEFPAQRLETCLDWNDLVLPPASRTAIDDISAWVEHESELMEAWRLGRRLKPGYRALFYGPPGTGKTLTASLLGRSTGRSVFRIDLGKLVSKFVGETEKNLASLLDHAERQRWILFFDEAESLFGQRTATQTSNDRFANQQVAYLLQRIEDYPGVALLATNLHTQLDEAFSRRFQAKIHFPMPDAGQRLQLWRDHFEDQDFTVAADVDLVALAHTHELAGGSIVNVLRFAALRAVRRNPPVVQAGDLEQGIRQELHKDGRYGGRGR